MEKVFLNYGQQINMLANDKKLNIPNPEYALEMLKRYSYYSLISGYKNEFKDPATAQYRPDVCFGDMSLYMSLMKTYGHCSLNIYRK